jgi:hypothetical protein
MVRENETRASERAVDMPPATDATPNACMRQSSILKSIRNPHGGEPVGMWFGAMLGQPDNFCASA